MSTRRKDLKGRVLRDGKSYRKNDGRYMYRYTSIDGKRHSIYDSDLNELRKKEEIIRHDLREGIRIGEDHITLNDVYEMWKKDKNSLKQTTKGNYVYMERFVMEEFGWRKLRDIRKSDVRRFYNSLLDTKRIKINTLDSIHTVVHQLFNLAIDGLYIKINPFDGVMGECKRAHNIGIFGVMLAALIILC